MAAPSGLKELFVTNKFDPFLALNGYQTQVFEEKWALTAHLRALAPSSRLSKAVLWFNGNNTYFYQVHVADLYRKLGYDVWVIDFPRCGMLVYQPLNAESDICPKNLIPPPERYDFKSVEDLYPPVHHAMAYIRSLGYTQLLFHAHSASGLIATSFCTANLGAKPDALILDGPFLVHHYNAWSDFAFEHLIPFVGAMFPKLNVSKPNATAPVPNEVALTHRQNMRDMIPAPPSGIAIVNDSYNTAFDTPHTCGWIRAMSVAQKKLAQVARSARPREGCYPLGELPILLLVSAHMRSDHTATVDPHENSYDGLVDVQETQSLVTRLTTNANIAPIDGGAHSVFLSRPIPTNLAKDQLNLFLSRTLPSIQQEQRGLYQAIHGTNQ